MDSVTWTNKRPGVWESKDGHWQIVRIGWRHWNSGPGVEWQVQRWNAVMRTWVTVESRETLARAKAKVNELEGTKHAG